MPDYDNGYLVTDTDFNAVTPVGSVLAFCSATPPSGWLLCNGQSLLRAGTYADLFAVLGTTYGAADGTHFNVPDIRGRVVAGYAASGGHTDVSTMAATDGSSAANARPTHKTSVAESSHNHTQNAHAHDVSGTVVTNLNAGGTLAITVGNGDASGTAAVSGTATSATATNQSATTGITAGVQAAGTPTDTGAYIVLNYIVRY